MRQAQNIDASSIDLLVRLQLCCAVAGGDPFPSPQWPPLMGSDQYFFTIQGQKSCSRGYVLESLADFASAPEQERVAAITFGRGD